MSNCTDAARWTVGLALCLMAFSSAAGAGEVVILDTTGMWRMHHTLKPPIIQLDSGPKTIDLRWIKNKRLLRRFDWARAETPPPAKGWTQAGFDDTAWLRGPARMCARTPLLSRLCMRSKFTVTNPRSVKGLKLSVGYRGGIIVYINGKEVGRRHLPARGSGEDKKLLADGYPAEAFTPVEGWGKKSRYLTPEKDADIANRRRSADIAIPAGILRKGVNVLALEIIRAPYHKILEERKPQRGSRYCPYVPAFNTCQIDLVQLKAAGGRGIVSNAARPKGFQVWNNSMLGADYDLDFGGPGEIKPIRLVGARNGRFSGKVVVGSSKPIRGLGVKAGDLTGPGGTIPASAVRIRYGAAWGREAGVNGQRTIHHSRTPEFNCYSRRPTMLGALLETPPAEVAVRAVKPGRHDLKTPGQPEPVAGAVVPVWVTVNVPATTRAGVYKGHVTIRARGEKPVEVPVHIEVADYTLPDPQNYRTMLELIQSPDTLVLEYGLKFWSDRHFEMIARSMKLMNEAGVQVLYVPLIAQTNLGNEQSMVRWIKKADGTYDFDFSIMKRYLDLAAEHMGKPKVVGFAAWDIYLDAGTGYKDTWGHNQKSVNLRKKFIGKGPLVTMLDRRTGKIETANAPRYTDPAAKVAWRKLFGELRRRMAARGWEKSMMIGFLSDAWPSREVNKFYHEVTGGLPWVSHSHVPVTRGMAKMEDGIVVTAATAQGSAKVNRVGFRVGYHSAVFNAIFPDRDPPMGSMGGWKREDMGLYQPRYERGQPSSRWRQLMELNIAGRQRGVARGGGDMWAIKNRRGRRSMRVDTRYPHSAWRNLDITWSMFAPGPAGPVATQQFEAMREGIQECQPRILIEEALTDAALNKKLGADLAKRCTEALVERTHHMLKAIVHLQINNGWGHFTGPQPICRQSGVNGHRWYVGSGWQARSRKLYSLAGEVTKKLSR